MKKRLLLTCLTLLTCVSLLSTGALAAYTVPEMNPYYTPPTGTATPASNDGATEAEPYVFTAKLLFAKWGEGNPLFSTNMNDNTHDKDSVKYKYEFTTPQQGAVNGTEYGSVSFSDNKVTYTPNANAANHTIKFKIYASYDGNYWTSAIIFTVKVGAVPEDAKSNNADLKSLSYQIGDNAETFVELTDGQTDYTVILPGDTQLGQALSLNGTTADENARISTKTAASASYSETEASITVTAENGATTKTYTVAFRVRPPEVEPGVTINGVAYEDGDTAVIYTNGDYKLWVTHGFGETCEGSAKVISSNLTIITPGEHSGVYPTNTQPYTIVTGAEGEAEVTVEFYNLNYSEIVDDTQPVKTLTLTIKIIDYVAVQSIVLDKQSLTLNIGETCQLAAQVLPENATDKTLQWTSADSDIAAVDQNGLVTAVGAGTTDLVVAANYGDETVWVTCRVTVKRPYVNIPDTWQITVAESAGGRVIPNFTNASVGTNISLTAVPDEGWELVYITVNGKRIDGTEFVMPNQNLEVKAVFAQWKLPFCDVPASAWYHDAVKYVYYADLMDGVEEHIFAPNDTLTRAMVWTIIARAEGIDTTGGATWYAKAQQWVVAKGISDGENPSAAITRQELVTMLWRLAGEPVVNYALTAPDADAISGWAYEAMCWAVSEGIIEGDENGLIHPTATCTRAEAAAILMRLG